MTAYEATRVVGLMARMLVTAALSTALWPNNALSQQPNIVLIVVDDAGFADFGFMGSAEIPTPNLDALANAGVRFTQAHTGAACSPSRAAILTGQFHNRFGYEANLQNTDDPISEHIEGLPNSAVTMFERLKTEGYSTSVTGKWHVGGTRDIVSGSTVVTPGNIPVRQGVDLFEGFQAGGGLQRMFENPDGTANITNYSAGTHWTQHWTDNTIDYIDDHYQDANPFFIYTSYNDPHSPIQATPIINDGRLDHLSGQRKTYASEILYIDDNVGRIVDKLEDPNGDGNTADSIMDETMIVFINDNGGVLGNSADNGDLRGQKGSPYDGGTRVPMFVSGAGVDPSAVGTTYEKLVHSIDIVPTMVAAASGTIPTGEVDGVNLLPFINGTDSSNPHAFIAQRIQEEVHYTTNDWKLVKNGYAGDWELYDFSDINNQSEDPSDDLAASNAAQLEIMQRLLTDWEVTIDKQRFPSTDESIGQFNLFDHFTFAQTGGNFSSTNGWLDPNGTAETMRDRDSHNGTVFHFTVSNSSSYTANNDLRRMNELEFIAHGFELEGNFSGVSNQKATIGGLPVLLAKNFDNELPYVHLNSTIGARAATKFAFELGLNAQLYDDLQITGDGTDKYRVTGDITEYRAGRAIAKTGTAAIHFAGRVEATGAGYLGQSGSTTFESSSVLDGNLTIADGATVELDGTVEGNVVNSGVMKVSAADQPPSSVVINLLPTLGDGDVDSRNTGTKGDRDSQILVGSVSNATAIQAERVQRALFSFDLSSIPDGTSITDATITLQFDGNDSSSNNNISGDLQLYELTEDPVFHEAGSENVDWIRRDTSGSMNWSTPGGTLGTLVANVLNANLPNPRTTVQGGSLELQSLSAFTTAIDNNLMDDVISFALLLPGEEADAAAMNADRDLYRFGSNESTGTGAAVLSISFEVATDTIAEISGDFTQDSTGSLQFDFRSNSDFDQLLISDTASLGGELGITLVGGFQPAASDTFEILSANTLTGTFDNVADGARLGLIGGGSFLVEYDGIANSVILSDFLAGIPGDFDQDGDVDGSDFLAWQRGESPEPLSPSDLLRWQTNYGSTSSLLASSAVVPEPQPFVLMWLAVACMPIRVKSRFVVRQLVS